MYTVTIILACIVLGLLACFHTYCTKVYEDIRKKDEPPTDSISIPPEIPKVTPPVVCEGVQIGVATYCYCTDPEDIVDVVSVEDGMVNFVPLESGYLNTLPVSDFLVEFTPREQTKISKL